MVDILTKEQRRKNMQAIRSKETKIENRVTKALWNRGFRIRKNVKDLFGKPDIAIKKYKAVIFIDSCFWHGCDIHGHIPKSNELYWLKKIIRNKQRDAEVTKYYFSQGWSIIRVWEHDIKNDFEDTISRISAFIQICKKK
jgi:DNA mismatch endonuclease (patch repair protein)